MISEQTRLAASGPALFSASELVTMLKDSRSRTLELVSDLSDEQMIGPRLTIVNPPLWEIGHVAWFQEFWVWRQLRKQNPLLERGDAIYNSTDVAHDTRWELMLPTREKTLAYMEAVLDRAIETFGNRSPNKEEIYFYLLAIFHEDMHDEAITYTRQTLGYSPPRLSCASGVHRAEDSQASPCGQDVEIPGGTLMLGARPDFPFVFDNDKWEHPVEIAPFRISRAPVTNGEFAAFVEDGGYSRRELWSDEGWRWLNSGGSPELEQSFSRFWTREMPRLPEISSRSGRISHPVYWQREGGGRWLCRVFDTYLPLRENLPVIHVNWHEAQAYCKWAGRRLPAEAEWEMAASAEPAGENVTSAGQHKRLFPWGNDAPNPERANLDGRAMGLLEVGSLPTGDNAFGCRQMIGNVWEWTASEFQPYPGFVSDPYKEYSAPWFKTHKVLRGGCWVTRARLIRNTWRNFYTPDRRDIWAGFRTCALQTQL
ncbi:MAG: SUMF1/EgtB/PvdO family nonheme iron enzyme [Deltaproteobacteria bacterium]|nr:SUMF1/EgtB/PvdO family nonheme iron enzyme [Deltaproteobacteria bacterium]